MPLETMNPGAQPLANGEYCAFGAKRIRSIATTFLERPQIVGHVWIFCRERFDVTDFYINSFYTWPFCARAEEPAPNAFGDDARSVEGVARDQKLHALTRAQIRTHYGALACSIFVQH